MDWKRKQEITESKRHFGRILSIYAISDNFLPGKNSQSVAVS